MRAHRRLLPALLLGTLTLSTMPAQAQSVPQTVQLASGFNTGNTSFLDGFNRPDPGWSILQYVNYSHLDAIKDANGDDVAAFKDTGIDASVLVTQFSRVTPYTLFGGAVGFNTLVSLVNLDASFADDSPAALSDNGFGVGDVTFGPYLQMKPTLHNGRPVFVQRFELDAVAPVGKFDRDRDLNPGSGYWSVVPNWAFTILPTPDWEISARLNYAYNFQTDKASNPPSGPDFEFHNGQAGDAAWINFASSYAVTPSLRLGINGYYLKQLRDNRTNGQRVPDTKQTKFYLGPGGSWRFGGHDTLNVNLYLPVDVKNAPAGNTLNLQYVHTF